MPEHDLIWMVASYIHATLFAVVLLFLPRGTPDEWINGVLYLEQP